MLLMGLRREGCAPHFLSPRKGSADHWVVGGETCRKLSGVDEVEVAETREEILWVDSIKDARYGEPCSEEEGGGQPPFLSVTGVSLLTSPQ